ncbi:MAG: preprotein translocase subunit YajC [Ruminococcaceae bacterium]|nr:preprotein translocase subunit YajC [Oscillospiraceae bacterium]
MGNYFLTDTAGGSSFSWSPIIMIVLLIGVFYLMYRSNKKQEKETSQMRNSLEIGDEITTIGGIIGEIVRIKEETITIETGKDRTKIRILRSAVRSVDVHAYEKRGDGKKPEPSVDEAASPKVGFFKKKKIKDKEATENANNVEENAASEATENNEGSSENNETAE